MSLKSQKIPLFLCAIILVVGISIGWRNQRGMALAEVRHAKLVAAARLAGIPSDEDATGVSSRSTKRERATTKADLDALLADVLWLNQMRPSGDDKKGPPPEELIRIQSFLERCGRLRPQEMEAFLGSLRSLPGISDEHREGLLAMALMAFSEAQPAHAIKMVSLDPHIKKDGFFRQLMTKALIGWTNDDLPGALEWVKAHPDQFDDDMRLLLIGKTADQDPAHGLRLLTEFQMKDPSSGFSILLTKAKPGDSQAVLTSFRQNLSQLPDEQSRESAIQEVLSNVADRFALGAFETHRPWLDSIQLTMPELGIFSTRVADTKSVKDPSQWIDWIGSKLPPEKSAAPIQTMVKNWTTKDYQAAGKWLTATPDGPTKNAAIRAYAETVAKADPAVAKQWALTLPPGPEREETLQRIQAK